MGKLVSQIYGCSLYVSVSAPVVLGSLISLSEVERRG